MLPSILSSFESGQAPLAHVVEWTKVRILSCLVADPWSLANGDIVGFTSGVEPGGLADLAGRRLGRWTCSMSELASRLDSEVRVVSVHDDWGRWCRDDLFDFMYIVPYWMGGILALLWIR